MCLEEDSHKPTTAADQLVLGNVVQLQEVRGGHHIFRRDVGGRAFLAERVQHILGKSLGQMRREVVDVVSAMAGLATVDGDTCLLYTSPSPRDATLSRMPSSA